jgi:hypothetical protein
MEHLIIYSNKFKNFLDYIFYTYWEEVGDPRVKNFFLAENGPLKIIAIVSFYFLFVTKIGPNLMKGRQAFKLTGLMVTFNGILVVVNAYLFCQVIYLLNFGAELLNFEFPDKNNVSAIELYKARIFHIYFLSKGILEINRLNI